MAKPLTYKPGKHINKQVKLMGLDGYQVLIILVLLLMLFFIKMILPILFLIPLVVILTKINKEIKKGNPSPISSFIIKIKGKEKIVDSDNVLNIIYKNGNDNK